MRRRSMWHLRETVGAVSSLDRKPEELAAVQVCHTNVHAIGKLRRRARQRVSLYRRAPCGLSIQRRFGQDDNTKSTVRLLRCLPFGLISLAELSSTHTVLEASLDSSTTTPALL